MDQYICLNCGYVFEEEKGVPATRMAPNWNAMVQSAGGCGWHKGEEGVIIGVAPGTKWADVPERFTCPSCGKTKDLFELV